MGEADNGWRSRVTLELLYFSVKKCLILECCRGLGSCLRISQPRMLLLSWVLLGAQIMEDVLTSSMALVLASTLQLLFRLVSSSTGLCGNAGCCHCLKVIDNAIGGPKNPNDKEPSAKKPSAKRPKRKKVQKPKSKKRKTKKQKRKKPKLKKPKTLKPKGKKSIYG